MRPWRVALGVLPLALVPAASAHRLDEYLQLTAISVGRRRVHLALYLTPGVAVSKGVIALIDADGDGGLSGVEERAYALRVGRDLALSVDGVPRPLRLRASRFPTVAAIREGTGEIRLDFDAVLSGSSGEHALRFENRHQRRLAAYLVECFAPDDPAIRVVAQRRSPEQARYEMVYAQA